MADVYIWQFENIVFDCLYNTVFKRCIDLQVYKKANEIIYLHIVNLTKRVNRSEGYLALQFWSAWCGEECDEQRILFLYFFF